MLAWKMSAAFASASPNDVVFYASLSNLGPTGAGPTRLHAYTSLVAGTGVYVFHEDATPPDAHGSPGNWAYNGTPVNRLSSSKLSPPTISRTCSPSGVTSMTARSV